MPPLLYLALGIVIGWCAAMLVIVLVTDGIWPFRRRGWRTWRDWQESTTVDHKRKAGW